MLTVAVSVDVPTAVAPVAEQVASDSCEAVVGEGRCPPAHQLIPGSITTWYAIIQPADPEASTLRIDFRDRVRGGALVETRHLAFSPNDSQESRWASAGLVVASFVAARDGSAILRPNDQALPREEPKEPESSGVNFDLAAFTGSGTEQTKFRFGGLARLGIEVPRAPGVITMLEGRYSERTSSVQHRWWSAAVGIGARVHFGESTLGTEFAGQLVLQGVHLSTRDSESGRTDRFNQNRLGGRLAANLFWDAWPSLALLAGGDVHLLRPEVSIYRRSEFIGVESSVGYHFSAGVRFSP